MTELATQQGSIFELQALIKQNNELMKRYESATKMEGRRERQVLVFAIQPNKGDAIPARIKNVITAKKLGPNLRHFMKCKGQYFDSVSLQNIPDLAVQFQEYWLEKMNDDSELAQAIRSKDGYSAIHNYIAGEVLRERHKQGAICDPGVAYALGLSAIAKETRNRSHEALQKAMRDVVNALQAEFKRNGIRLDSRQNAIIDAIIKLNLQKGFDHIAEDSLANFDELERRMTKLVSDMSAEQIEDKSKEGAA